MIFPFDSIVKNGCESLVEGITFCLKMQVKSLKINFFLNILRTVLNFLIPLITFPYISRVLAPEGIGKVEFANSIVSYFVLFTSLGIPTYGIREIARVRDNKFQRSATVFELTAILLITNVIGYLLYFCLLFFIPIFHNQWILFCIVAPNIALSGFCYEWFYQGIEDQTYITIRFIIIKILQIVGIFLLIKNSEHYYRYAVIYVGLNSFSAIFNIIHLRKYIGYVSLKEMNIRRHLKSILIIFSSLIAVSIYANLDVAMLGFFCCEENIGLYTAANKLVRLVITLITVFCAVLIPRIENSLATGDKENYKKYINISLYSILFLGLPCCLGLIALSSDVIIIFAGEKYIHAILTMKILSPIIIIVGLAYFVGLQVLYPLRQEWKYTVSVTIAAVVNSIFNAIMIPVFAQNGAAFGTVIAELIGLLILIMFAWKYLKETDLFSWNTVKYIVSSLFMFIAILSLPNFSNTILHCLLSILLGVVVYIVALFVLRESLIVNTISILREKLIEIFS